MLRKEISVVIVLKLCFLMLLWYVCFRSPIQPSARQTGLTERFFQQDNKQDAAYSSFLR